MLQFFSETDLARRLDKLPWQFRLTFGIACADRLVPNYQRFVEETGWGEIRPIKDALEFLSKVALGDSSPTDRDCDIIARDCEAQTPHSDEFDSLFVSSAQDAVFATCSLLDFCLSFKTEQVILAARYPIESIDLYVQELEGISPTDPDRENKILSHYLMQQELTRQDRDLRSIESIDPSAIIQIISRRGTEAAFTQQPIM